ncbi:hypothetical protein PENTCL1PPCAC_4106, partial [Pristionchus entomophagus]
LFFVDDVDPVEVDRPFLHWLHLILTLLQVRLRIIIVIDQLVLNRRINTSNVVLGVQLVEEEEAELLWAPIFLFSVSQPEHSSHFYRRRGLSLDKGVLVDFPPNRTHFRNAANTRCVTRHDAVDHYRGVSTVLFSSRCAHQCWRCMTRIARRR